MAELRKINVEGIGTLEVPIDFTDEQINQALMKQFGTPSDELPDPDVPTTFAGGAMDVDTQVGSLVAGAREGALLPPQDSASQNARSIRQRFGDDTRLASLAAGGAIGAELANRNLQGFDPRVRAVGTVVGGGLGTVIGSLSNDAIRETPTQESVINALKEGGLDVSFGLGVPAAVRSLGILGEKSAKALGVDKALSNKLLSTAERIGARIGTVDMARVAPIKGVKTVLGVFPFVGTPFRTAAKQTQGAVVDTIDKYLDIAGPNASLASVGVDMSRAADNTFKEFKGVSSALYRNFDDMADLAGATVPTSSIKQAALDASGRMRMPEGIPEGDPTAVRDFVTALREIPDEIPIQELRGLQMRMSELFEDAGNIEMRRLMMVKQGTEEALSQIKAPNPEAAQQLKGMLETANGFYASGMKAFENPTASKFGRVDKNMFRAGSFKAANLNPDEIAELGMNFRSPQAVRDLRALVGEDNLRKGLRGHLQRSIDAAIERSGDQVTFNFRSLQNALGAGPNKTISREAVDEAFKNTPIDSGDFLRVLELAENMGTVPVASQFIARRATLGGARSGLRAAMGMGLAAGAAGTAPISSVLGFGLARAGASALQSPRVLKAIVRASDPSLTPAQAEVQLVRLMSMFLEMRPTAPEEP